MNYAAIATDLIESGVTMPAGADPVELVRIALEAENDRAWDVATLAPVPSLALKPLRIVGYLFAGGPVCGEPDCLSAAAEGPGTPVFAGDASDDHGFLTCTVCMEVLDRQTELELWHNAPIPTPATYRSDAA